jgi:hypothetical protein
VENQEKRIDTKADLSIANSGRGDEKYYLQLLLKI